MYKLGEYPIAAKFPITISAFSILFYGANKRGSVIIDLFRTDGTIISSVTLQKITNGPYYFTTPTAEIAGFSMWNTDVGGLGIAKIGYNQEVLECFCEGSLVLSGEFDTDGNIDTLPLDLSPNDDWYYVEFINTPIATSGIVTPAQFDMNGVSELTISSFCFKGTLAAGTDENLTIQFNTFNGGSIYVRIKQGENQSRVYYGESESGVGQNFTGCLNAPESMVISVIVEENVIKVYKYPDSGAPIATLNETLIVQIPSQVTRIVSAFVGTATTINSSLDYIRAFLK